MSQWRSLTCVVAALSCSRQASTPVEPASPATASPAVFKGTSDSVAFVAGQQGFSRDQGVIEGLARWGNEIVALSRPPCRLNLDSRACEPISNPLLGQVLAVGGDTVRFAAGTRGGRPALVRERDGKWEDVALPAPAVGRGLAPVALAASGEEVALLEVPTRDEPGNALFNARHQETWSTTDLPPQGPSAIPKHVVFARGRWLLGYNSGEWGGELRSIAPGGAVTALLDGDPITGIAVAPDGRVYVSTGLAHLGGVQAHIGSLDRDWKWTTLFRISNFHEDNGVGWNLEPDTVTGLSVDAAGRLYLLTGSQGVVREDGGKLVSVTPGWPRGHLYGKGLLIERDTAVVGTFDSGVVLWKLGTDQGRRIEVPARR